MDNPLGLLRIGRPRDDSGELFLEEGDSATIGKIYVEADARRVVACVNACQGIEDEALASFTRWAQKTLAERNALKARVIKLAGLLQACVSELPDRCEHERELALAALMELE